MSLREELTGRLEECYELGSNDGDRPNSADATEIIDKVLDAAVKAANSRLRGIELMSWEFDAGVTEAITAINKLRGEK